MARGISRIKASKQVYGTTGGTSPPPPPPPSGPAAAYTMDFMTQTYQGAAVGDIGFTGAARTVKNAAGQDQQFAANVLPVNDLGFHVIAKGATALSPYSVTPANWVQSSWFNAPVEALPVSGIFSPVLVKHADSTDSIGAARTPGQLMRAVVPDEIITTVIRCKQPAVPRPSNVVPGFTIQLMFKDDANAEVAARSFNCHDMTVANPVVTSDYNPNNVVASIKRTEKFPDGSVETEIQFTVPAGVTKAQVNLGGRSFWSAELGSLTTDLQHWGIHVEPGDKFNGWIVTNNVLVAGAGDVITLGGILDDVFLAAEGGGFCIEFQEVTPNAAGASQIVSAGLNDALTVLGLDGWSGMAVNNGQKTAAYGLGGAAGITRMVITRDANNWRACVNGGEVITGATDIPVSAAVHLLKNVNGRIRRIEGYSGLLTEVQCQQVSTLIGRTFPNAGDAFVPTATATVTFHEPFTDPATLKSRASTAYTQTGSEDSVLQYKNLPGKWYPRYVQWTNMAGSAQAEGSPPPPAGQPVDNGINQEHQFYYDPDSKYLLNVDGYTTPFRWDLNPGKLTIRAEFVGPDRPNLVAKMPYRLDTGVKYKYISGAMITAGYFEQKFGYFEVRAKVPKGMGLWPAFWGLQGIPHGDPGGPLYWSDTELDVVEYVGQHPTESTSAIHANNYGFNQGIEVDRGFDFSQDFHTFAAHWVPGRVDFFIDGKKSGSISTAGTNFDNFKQYLLLNVAVGDNGSWIGVPDASTEAGGPYDFVIDWVKVLQTQ